MTIFDQAIIFAVKAHSGMTRKGTSTPYITHPLEAASIAATLTDDPDVLAAAVLHDVVEDTPYTYHDICKEFGCRIADLVMSDSEDKQEHRPASETWKVRKQHTLNALADAAREEKIIAFADKLSNLRAIHRDYCSIGEALWSRFNQKDPTEHLWYYGSFLSLCEEFSDTAPYREYAGLFDQLRSQVMAHREPGAHGTA